MCDRVKKTDDDLKAKDRSECVVVTAIFNSENPGTVFKATDFFDFVNQIVNDNHASRIALDSILKKAQGRMRSTRSTSLAQLCLEALPNRACRRLERRSTIQRGDPYVRFS